MNTAPIYSLAYNLRHLPTFSPTPKTVVLASGTGSNFKAILEAVDQKRLEIEVVGLIYNIFEAKCSQIATNHNIPSHFIDHKNYPNRRTFDADVVQQLKKWNAELVVMAGWMRIASPTLINEYQNRITNLHPSLLPSFRGLHAIDQALQAGVTLTGCTVHLVNDSLDDGPILGQAALPILPHDTLDSLTQRIHDAEHTLYPLALQHLITQNRT